MLPLYIKAIHIIVVVSWFAGLFYVVRLFIYHTEAEEKPEQERKILQNQFKIMERKLWYIITWPSAILTVASGFYLVYLYNYWTNPWMLVKFSLVFGLILYHLQCGRIFSRLQKDLITLSSFKLRMWNEVATIFLIAIVFVIVLKDTLQWLWGIAGILIIGLTFMLIIKAVKRKKK